MEHMKNAIIDAICIFILGVSGQYVLKMGYKTIHNYKDTSGTLEANQDKNEPRFTKFCQDFHTCLYRIYNFIIIKIMK